jgi:hypothetical protein
MHGTEGATPATSYFDAKVRGKFGEAIRSQHELAGPLPERLYNLLQEAEQRIAQFRKRKAPTRRETSANGEDRRRHVRIHALRGAG